MIDRPAISVVMPAYNAECYIGQAIESVLNQTFSLWELIIINDGSTDNTLKIIQRYASSDNRIKYSTIINSGTARVPRLMAVMQAVGDYIITLDADDYIEIACFEKMYEKISTTHADILLQRLAVVDDNHNVYCVIPHPGFDLNQMFTGKEACALTIGDWEIGAAGAMYKASLFQSYVNSDCGTFHYMNEDELDTRKLFLKSSLICLSDTCYYYRYNNSSITKKVSGKQFDILITASILRSIIEKNYSLEDSIYEKLFAQQFNTLLSCRIYYLTNRISLSLAEREKGLILLKGSFDEIRKQFSIRYFTVKRAVLLGNYLCFNVISSFYFLLFRRKYTHSV